MQKLPEVLAKAVRDCRDRGLNKHETAKELGITHSKVRSICHSFSIGGWKRGAAARDQSGVLNSNYQNGLSRSSVTRITKQVLFEVGRDLFTCERCKATRDIEWPRHHKDRNRANNAPANIEVLCVSCHSKEHMTEKTRYNGVFLS